MTREPRRSVEGDAVLRFAPHTRFRFDEVRQAWIVLAPERLMLPDEQAVEILQLIDGKRAVDQLQDFDRLLVGQQQPLGRKHDPGLPHVIEAEFGMPGKAQDRLARDRRWALGAHCPVRPGTKAPGGVSPGST